MRIACAPPAVIVDYVSFGMCAVIRNPSRERLIWTVLAQNAITGPRLPRYTAGGVAPNRSPKRSQRGDKALGSGAATNSPHRLPHTGLDTDTPNAPVKMARQTVKGDRPHTGDPMPSPKHRHLQRHPVTQWGRGNTPHIGREGNPSKAGRGRHGPKQRIDREAPSSPTWRRQHLWALSSGKGKDASLWPRSWPPGHPHSFILRD